MPVSFSRFFSVIVLFLLACTNQEPTTPEVKTEKAPDSSLIKKDAGNPYATVDVSPMDMSYFPVDYPVLKMTGKITEAPVARVIYSRPHLEGRKMLGHILKYGEIWRLGANESTEIEFYRSLTIHDKKIPAGRYILYAIPHEDHWTIALNSNTDTWGLRLDATKDIARFDIPVTNNNPTLEYFTIVFEKTDKGADLIMGWENALGRLPISF